jgi:hypothetical protein
VNSTKPKRISAMGPVPDDKRRSAPEKRRERLEMARPAGSNT